VSGPEDFGGSDYMDPEEEKRYIEQQRKRREEQPVVTKQPAFGLMGEGELMEQCEALFTRTCVMQQLLDELSSKLLQATKNCDARAEFLQQLVDSSEAANIERQGKIEALEKEQEALLVTVAQLRSDNKKLGNQVRVLEGEKKVGREVVDYRRVDEDLLTHLAMTYLQYGPGDEVDAIESDIQEQVIFHPHVQQEVLKDGQGVLRFRKNELVNRLVEEAGTGSGRLTGLNYIATLEASTEDRAQLAQLIGYSVDGYQSLSYSLPLEEDKIPQTK
jgi:hypothetical protein